MTTETIVREAATRQPVRIRFSVTQEHIDAGVPIESSKCPVSLALQEHGFPIAFVSVEDVWIRAYGEGHEWTLDAATREFVEAFDSGQPVKPFTGEIYR